MSSGDAPFTSVSFPGADLPEGNFPQDSTVTVHDRQTPRRYRGAFARLYRGEMRLLLIRRRNIILLAVLAVVPIFIGVAVKISSPRAGDGPQFIGRITGCL